jgi:hypothetical protein
VSDGSRFRPSRLRLTPWGWILTVALVVLAILAIVDPGPGVIIGLIAVIFVWAGLLSSSFPSSQMMSRSRFLGGTGGDAGEEAAKRYEREHR